MHLENGHDFYGKESLVRIGSHKIEKKLVGIEIIGKAIARKGCKIFQAGKLIGNITSGSWSPTIKKPIALGYINTEYSELNQEVEISIRGKFLKGIICKKAFYKKDF